MAIFAPITSSARKLIEPIEVITTEDTSSFLTDLAV